MSLFFQDPLADTEALIRRVYAYVAYRIGDGPLAEDVTSDVFERALRYRDRFDARRGEPAAWLFGIARRCVADAVAARTTDPVPSDNVSLGSGGADAFELEGHVVRRVDLARAIAALDERDRELLALRYGGDLTARQIADLSGVRTNAIEVALHRALARLRSTLGGGRDDELPAALLSVRV